MDVPEGWEEVDGALQREFRFRDFTEALAFVNRLGELAEGENHHPDIAIHWNRVTLRWWTHVKDAITERDVELSTRTNELLTRAAPAFARPVVPLLRVDDLEGSVGFYTELLGFEVVEQREEGGEVAWARLRHGPAEVMVSAEPGQVRTNPGEGPILYLYPADTEAFHSSLVDKGATVGDLRRSAEGTAEFELVDPDGYELWFGGPPPATA